MTKAESLPIMGYEQTNAEISTAQQAIESLSLSSNVTDRAYQLAHNTSPEGILLAITELHTALVPDISHEPSQVARTIVNQRSGEEVATLAAPEERAEIFGTASDVIKGLGQKVEPGQEQAFLNRSANVLALAVVLTHTFEDGNGRTARTLAHAVRYGSEVNEANKADFEVVSKNRPDTGFKISSYVPTNEGSVKTAAELLMAAASPDIPLTNAKAYADRVHENFTLPYSE